ncbi:hypothetical protein VTK73DRAFT_6021 [Phialemonium thermophilum]|uniref:Uncharacterized protein n=1 Tax=Phialemonium thermophilum TaxID=223376 RepID=A0ABR3V0S9_9PEZI
MGPAKRGGGSSSGEYNLSIIGASLRSGTINERKDALDNLLFYFNHVDKRWSQGPNQSVLIRLGLSRPLRSLPPPALPSARSLPPVPSTHSFSPFLRPVPSTRSLPTPLSDPLERRVCLTARPENP